MNNLPEVNIRLTEAQATRDSGIKHFLFDVTTKEGKTDFNTFFSELVDNDCFALVVCNEIIFNNYGVINISEKLSNYIKIKHIIEKPEVILNTFYFDVPVSNVIEMYIANNPTRKIVLTYNQNTWNVDYYIDTVNFV